LGGDLSSIEGAIASISLFGSNNSSFGECNEKTSNPQTQYDLSPVPFGYKYSYCIPPIAVAFGDGNGAQLIPIVANGSIFSVEVINGGSGYVSPLSIAIIDNSGYGQGAQVDAIVDSGGSITGAIVISGGSGYCPGNYNNVGIDTNITDVNTLPITGISTSIVGNVDSVYIIAPGIGYTTGDTISIGTTTISPIITPNGSVVKVEIPNNFNQLFTRSPIITINTNTGVGAEVIPVMKYTQQGTFVNKDSKSVIDQKQVINVVDCV
jgi:hypothetical protein